MIAKHSAVFAFWLLSLALGRFPIAAHGAAQQSPQSGNDLVKAEMVADTTAIRAGQPFRVAVQFTIEPHWHVYWSNPGETGMPTKMKLELPEGFTASDIQYPAPKRFVAAGDIVGYGYEDEVLLLATITPPATLADQATKNLSAKASWLVCSEDLCLPGKQDVSLALPVNAEPEPANAELFKKWSARVPVKPEAANQVVGATAKPPAAGSDRHTVIVKWKQAPKAVDWFPPALSAVNFEDLEIDTAGDETTISFSATALTGQKLPEGSLESVVVFEHATGGPIGIVVPFELQPSKQPGDTVSRRQ